MREAGEACSKAYLGGIELFVRQAEINSRAREAAARLVGASAEDVALTQNTTHGMNLGVGAVDWEEGDEVISTSTEHPGCLVPLHNLGRRYGVKTHLISPPITTEKIEAAITPKTRMIALSHVDWTTGEVLPLAEISTLARERGGERGILTLVDGAQSVGNIPVNIPDTGVDMYAFTGHKWLLGPEGMGAFYVRPGCKVPSANAGYASLAEGATFDVSGDYDLRPGGRRFEASTVSPTLAGGFAAAASAAHERGAEGLQGIRRRADLLLDRLTDLPGVTIRSPRPAQSGLVSFEIDGLASKEAVERLLERRFVVRYIPDPHPYVRVSTHLFNTDEELEALARSVGKL